MGLLIDGSEIGKMSSMVIVHARKEVDAIAIIFPNRVYQRRSPLKRSKIEEVTKNGEKNSIGTSYPSTNPVRKHKSSPHHITPRRKIFRGEEDMEQGEDSFDIQEEEEVTKKKTICQT